MTENGIKRTHTQGMLNAVDKSGYITSLLDTNLVSSLFLEIYAKEKKYEAGTTKTYLMSLRHFYSLLLLGNPDDVSGQHPSKERLALAGGKARRE